MSENVLIALISGLSIAVGAIVAGAVTWYVAIKKLPSEIKETEQDTKTAGAEEILNLTKALNESISGLSSYASASAKKEEAWNIEREYMKKEIGELKAHKDERSRMIFEIQQKQEASDREHVAQIAALRKQIEDGSVKYESLKRQTLKMYQALKDNNIEIDIDPDFRDTLERMKAVK